MREYIPIISSNYLSDKEDERRKPCFLKMRQGMGKKCGILLLAGGEGNGKAEDEKNMKERDVENVP